MEKKYVFTWGSAVGGYEACMKGWPGKVGFSRSSGFYSRFYKAEPRNLQYRMELSNPKLHDNGETQEKLISLFNERGWTHVSGKGERNVFSAPEGSEAPDVYAEPEQRKAALRILRNDCGSLWFLLFLAVFPLVVALIRSDSGFAGAFRQLIYTWLHIYYERTAFLLLLIMLVIYYELYSIRALFICKKFKKQGYLDRAPSKWSLPYKAARALALLLCLVFLALSVAQWALNQKYEMPLDTDEPYLLLKDLGWEGERSTVFDSGPRAPLKSTARFCSRAGTHTSASSRTAKYWMYQSIYELKNPRRRRDMLRFSNAPDYLQRDRYWPVQAEGFDLAYRNGMYYLAVKDNYVCQIAYYETGSDADNQRRMSLQRLRVCLKTHIACQVASRTRLLLFASGFLWHAVFSLTLGLFGLRITLRLSQA